MHLNVAVNKKKIDIYVHNHLDLHLILHSWLTQTYMLIVYVYYRKAATRTRPRLLARAMVL